MTDLALLRQVIAYARTSGWSHDITQYGALPLEHRWTRGGVTVSVWAARLDVNDAMVLPADVRQGVDVLVALGVLPPRFSSAYAEASAEIEQLRSELAEANGKVKVLMYGDAHMQSRIWLNEECLRLKGERNKAQADLAAAQEHHRKTVTGVWDDTVPPDDHDCGYEFRPGLGYLAVDPDCQTCCDLATAKWKEAWTR